jgi:hypothetical protein
MGLAFAAMMGWCGTLWPGWWKVPHPHPDPDPWWWIIRIVGAAGGIGAWVVLGPLFDNGGLAAMTVVSFFGGTFAGSVVEGLRGLSGPRTTVTTGV